MRKLDLDNLELNDQNLVDHIKKTLISFDREPIKNILDIDFAGIYINAFGSVFVNYRVVYKNSKTWNDEEFNCTRFFIKGDIIFHYSSGKFYGEYKPISELVGIVFGRKGLDPRILLSNPDTNINPSLIMSAFKDSKDKSERIGLVELKYLDENLSFLINKNGDIVSDLYDSTINSQVPQPFDIFLAEGDFILRANKVREAKDLAIKNGQAELYEKLYTLKPTIKPAEEGEA